LPPTEHPFRDWRADLARYDRQEWFTEPAVWAQTVYRFGRWAMGATAPVRPMLTVMYVTAKVIARIASGVEMPRTAVIGPGLRIAHGGPIVIHPGSRIGANCLIGHGVTLGMRETPDELPVIEDNVTLSAFTQVLGGVVVGRGAKTGAMALVLSDIPPDTTAAGIPARVLGKRTATT
jgi:serine O-acetyltransferase